MSSNYNKIMHQQQYSSYSNSNSPEGVMKKFVIFSILLLVLSTTAFSDGVVSPLFYLIQSRHFQKKSHREKPSAATVPVSIRFSNPPSESLIDALTSAGVSFRQLNGSILHTRHVYIADVPLDSIEEIAGFEVVERIEPMRKPFADPTLNVSNPQVQASRVWDGFPVMGAIDGEGVIVANVDTGIDIYHPGFFKPDGGTYDWIDTNSDGSFTPGYDAVDLNFNGVVDSDETLHYYDASFSDPLNLMERSDGLYDADIDWLFNDANGNDLRDYGPQSGFSESSPCFGELIFITIDTNSNNRLDPGESITALGTSKIIATFDKNGIHRRGIDLFDSLGDTFNHGTGSAGIVLGQTPGRRLTGMAPGAEIISIDRDETDIEEGILFAVSEGADIIFYEFANRVAEFLDGTSNLEILINELYSEGIHQITASGNLAGPERKKHSMFILEKGETGTLRFTVPDTGINSVYTSILWHEGYLDPSISLLLPDGTEAPVYGDTRERRYSDFTVISGDDISPKNTSRMDVLVSSDTPFSGTFTFLIRNRRANPLTLDAYIADNVTQWMHGAQFLDHVTDDGTVCMPGTSEKGITVGAYDPRGTRNTQGDINDFSSWGKTTDGRRAVDITAPGTLVYSLTSHDKTGGAPGGYLDFGGTSAALPHVVGCAALMIDAFPDFSPDDVKEYLLGGAIADSFTGHVPNDKWGYGKLRILDSFLLTGLTTQISSDTEYPSPFILSAPYPNPFNSHVQCTIQNVSTQTLHPEISIYNILGQRIFSTSVLIQPFSSNNFTWNGTDVKGIISSSGIYFISVMTPNHTTTRRILFTK